MITFPYELDTITLRPYTEAQQVDVVLNGQNILSATLTPDSTNNITLSDMGRYLSDRVEEVRRASSSPNAFSEQTLNIQVAGKTVKAYTLRPCRSRMRKKAADLVPTIFLTMATGGTKLMPAICERERLYLLSDEETGHYAYTITTYWQHVQSRVMRRTSATTEGHANPGQLVVVDVTPYRPTPPPDDSGLWLLMRYDIKSNGRSLTYKIAPDGLAQSEVACIEFENSFGLIDTFYFQGQIEKEVKPTYSAASINGTQQNYSIDTLTTYKAATGPLTDAMVALLTDLATSCRVEWNGRPITITACELKPVNTFSEMQKATITWREGNEGTELPRGTFDNTFDATFDRTT